MSGTYPSAFDALPDSVKAMIATTIVTPIEPLFALGWNDDIAELIARFVDGIGKPYVGRDQAAILADLVQRRADWQAKKNASNGHGNGHVEPAGADDPEATDPTDPPEVTDEATNPADPTEAAPDEGDAEPAPTGAVLEPNLADINAHLYAIFDPDFVKDHPDAWIEVATADPNAPDTVDEKGRKKDNTGVKAGRHFTPFELDKAAAYAVRMNKQGRNIYIGMALRQGETGPSGRSTKANVVTTSRGWGDFDKQGDDDRISTFLDQHALGAAEIVVTGTIPHPRIQVFFRLSGGPSQEEIEAVNAAIRDQLGGNGDGVQNCDRVMRLAGTVSYPPPKKVARGYGPELTQLVIKAKRRAYTASQLIRLLSEDDKPGTPAGPDPSGSVVWLDPKGPPVLQPKKKKSPGKGDDDEKKFGRRVNEMALANLNLWVPEIFGDDAKFQKGTGAYRISSSALGRDLEEDLAIHPKGVTDWGEDDQGKPGEKAGRFTAIDLVIKYGGAPNFKKAAFWLCEKCGVDPASLGWETRGGGAGADKTFLRQVNDMVFANLGTWVPKAFPNAEYQQSNGAYRIPTGEEDKYGPFLILPAGPFSIAVPGKGEYPAIDFFKFQIRNNKPDATDTEVALQLCELCSVDAKTLGWTDKKAGEGVGNPEIERLAALSWVDYEKERKKAAKELGFRVSVLDDLVGQLRGEDQQDEAKTEIEQINTDHVLVLAGDKAAVMRFEGSATKFRLLQISAFKAWFANQFVRVGKDLITLGDYWMGHTERRQYSGIEFAPPGSALPSGFYNLWQGFAVERRKGDCSKFLAHVRDNVARGDEATFLWIIGWWAAIFQLPSTKMETALGIRGPQGTGKTKLGEVMGTLIGEAHYLAVASPRYITGQFNSHMASILVMQADEAFWAGDKKGEGILKDLVSGKGHMLEYKGVDPIKIKNFIRLYVTGNAEWLVPAGLRDRRWAIFDIGEDKMQDNAYFAAIDEEMNNGGREALLDYLLEFDLKQVNLRVIPKTAALLDQQLESMTHEQSWWFETLMKGVLPPQPRDFKEVGICPKDNLFEYYIQHARVQGINRRSTETKIGMFLDKQLGTELKHPRPLIGEKQIRCFGLPPLADCRKRFAESLGQPVNWGEGWETVEWQHGTSWWA